jgi:hypothetical protein
LVLWDPEEISDELRAIGLRVERCEEVVRPLAVETGAQQAIDVLADARRPSAPSP